MSVSNQAKSRGKILDEIMTYHREQLPKTMREVPLADLRAFTAITSPPLDFYAALKKPGVSLIAECKKASPSKGLMVRDYDPVALAKTYAKAGASAISVLTDARHFQGSLEHLRDVKEAIQIIVDGKLPTDRILGKIFKIEEVNEAFEHARENKESIKTLIEVNPE